VRREERERHRLLAGWAGWAEAYREAALGESGGVIAESSDGMWIFTVWVS